MSAFPRFGQFFLGLSTLLAGIALHAAPLRVALNPFTSDDVSYRSGLAAADFTAVLQAQLNSDAALQWVERAELAKVESELKLGALGLVNRSDAARAGRIAGADWAVYGRFTTNAPGAGRTLALELVDLTHAEPLGETNLPFAAPATGPLRITADSAVAVAQALADWLRQARGTAAARAGQLRVAILPIPSEFNSQRTGDLAPDLAAALAAGTTNVPLHVVRFTRAGRAVDEADLALSGLAETDHDAWLKVADWYVWGSVTSRFAMRYDKAVTGFVKDTVYDSAVSLWDGRGQPLVLTNTPLTNPPPAALAALFASRLAPLLIAHAGTSPDDSARRAVALAMRGQAEALLTQHDLWLSSPESQLAWFSIIEALDLACFFDPGDATARELWVRTRYASGVRHISRSHFRFGWVALAAWGRQVERFGLDGAVTDLRPFGDFARPTGRSTAECYVASAAEIFSPVMDEEDDHPRDVGAKVLAAWYADAAHELAVRWLALGDRPESVKLASEVVNHVPPVSYEDSPVAFAPERLRALRAAWLKSPPPLRPLPGPVPGVDHAAVIRLCQDAAEPAVAEQLFAFQAAAAAAGTATPTTNVNANAAAVPVPLPRAETLDERGEGGEMEGPRGWFDGGKLEFPLPQADVEPEYIPFPSRKMEGVRALVVVDDQPWFLASGEEEVTVAATDAQLSRELRTPTATFTRLWTVKAGSAGNVTPAERAPGAVATQDFYSLVREADGLRLQTERGSTSLFLPSDLSLRPLPQSLSSGRPLAVTNVHMNTELFLAAPGGWWVGGVGGLAWCATNGPSWDDFYEPPLHVEPSFFSRFSMGGGSPPPGDHEPLRILNELTERMQRRDRPPVSPGRLPGRVVALAPDGDYLWVVADAFAPGSAVSHVLVLHTPSRRWVNSLAVPVRVRAVGVTRTHVWLGVDASRHKGDGSPLWRYAKAPLLAVPEARWLPQVPSAVELAAALAALSPEQRAVHDLFHGAAQRFVDLHRDEAPADLSVEDLFLLAAAYDPRGLNDPEKLAKLARLLVREHLSSPFASLARKRWRTVLGEPAANAPVADRAQQFMTRFDADHDGFLNLAEFGRLLFEEDSSFANLLASASSFPPGRTANDLYIRLHRTDARGVTLAELVEALSTLPSNSRFPNPGISPFPRRSPVVRP